VRHPLILSAADVLPLCLRSLVNSEVPADIRVYELRSLYWLPDDFDGSFQVLARSMVENIILEALSARTRFQTAPCLEERERYLLHLMRRGFDPAEAKEVAAEVALAVAKWREEAKNVGISDSEIARMSSAFDHQDLKKALRSSTTALQV